MNQLQEEAALGHYVSMKALFYRSGGRLVVYEVRALGPMSTLRQAQGERIGSS